jgi:serine/threonine protein kinase
MPSIVGPYRTIHTLGKGAQATVKLAVNQNNEQCALKIFKYEDLVKDEKAMNNLKAEVDALIHLQHPHVMRLLGCDF